jgi:hypothetical protein
MERSQSDGFRNLWQAAQIVGAACLVVFLVWQACVGLENWRLSRATALYQHCLDRGGSITEGPWGVSCVGLKTSKDPK